MKALTRVAIGLFIVALVITWGIYATRDFWRGFSTHSPITPPPAWKGTPQVAGSQTFTAPDGLQRIIIMHPKGLVNIFGQKVEKWGPITICDGHPARLIIGHGMLGKMDAVYTNWDGQEVAAMYSRPFGTPPDPEAEKSIRSLCSAY